MPDKLSNEIILNISSLLALNDKPNLITTCQLLCNLIARNNLSLKLNLLQNDVIIEKCIKKFQENPSFDAQVRHLFINMNNLSEHLSLNMPILFPNIKCVSQLGHCHDVTSRAPVVVGPLLQWISKIDTHNAIFDWPDLLPVFKTTIFSCSTKMIQGYTDMFSDGEEGYCTMYFAPHFSGVPSLEELIMDNCFVSLDLLEKNTFQLSSS